MELPLDNLRILITGTGGTLGRSLVEQARTQGAIVAASARLATLSRNPLPSEVQTFPADLRDPEECLRLPGRAAEQMGGLDVLINNAALLTRKPFTSFTTTDLDEAWAVNLRAPVLLMQAALPFLKRGTNPAIVNVVSSAGISGGIASVSAYAMTKAGLIVATKTVAREYAPFGIRVNAISPPTFDSAMQRDLTADEHQRVRNRNVFGRLATAEEVAQATLLLASSQTKLVTGTTLDATAFVE